MSMHTIFPIRDQLHILVSTNNKVKVVAYVVFQNEKLK